MVQLLFYMKPTGKASFAPHGNANRISKPSATKVSPIGHPTRSTANPTHDNTNSCALMQPREIARAKGERYFPGAYRFVTADVYRTRFATDPLPTGASVWYHSFDGSCWLGKIKQASDAPGRYIIRFVDNSGPVLIDLPPSAYKTALHAPCLLYTSDAADE